MHRPRAPDPGAARNVASRALRGGKSWLTQLDHPGKPEPRDLTQAIIALAAAAADVGARCQRLPPFAPVSATATRDQPFIPASKNPSQGAWEKSGFRRRNRACVSPGIARKRRT